MPVKFYATVNNNDKITTLLTEPTKFSRTYTNGHLPTEDGDEDVIQRYRIELDNEPDIKIKFPAKTNETGDGTLFEIFFESQNQDGDWEEINNTEIDYRDFSNDRYNFRIRINKNVLQSLDGTVQSNKFLRNFILNGLSTGQYGFRLKNSVLSFENMSVSRVTLEVNLLKDGEVVDFPEKSNNLFGVRKNPLDVGVFRTQPLVKGFIDDNRPNTFFIEFERTGFGSDVDDEYEIYFKSSLNGLETDTSLPFKLISGQFVEERQEYMTRMTVNGQQTFSEDINVLENGQIDIPEVGVLVYKFDPSSGDTFGASLREDEIYAFYINASGVNVNIDGLTIGGLKPDPQSTTGTKTFGPFSPNIPVEIRGEMGVGNTGRLTLTHYAYLSDELGEQLFDDYGNPVSSQLDTQQTVFNLQKQTPTDPPPTDPPFNPSQLFTLNTAQPPRVVDIIATRPIPFYLNDDGQPLEAGESIPLALRVREVLFDGPASGSISFVLEFDVDNPTEGDSKDTYLQYRQVNGSDQPSWYTIPNILLTTERVSTGANLVRIGLTPYTTTLQDVYEFRSISVTNPDIKTLGDDRITLIDLSPSGDIDETYINRAF